MRSRMESVRKKTATQIQHQAVMARLLWSIMQQWINVNHGETIGYNIIVVDNKLVVGTKNMDVVIQQQFNLP